MTAKSFAQRVLDWHAHSGRHHLPWQRNQTPYRVWVSEIMLQQTQVATVIPYFETFMQRYPSVTALAKAPIDDVLHLWTGLGYYARARNLHRCAQIVDQDFSGHFPNSVEGLTALPGIGRSTAGAILALGSNIRAPILDGNVKRVLCRYHAIEGWPDSPATQKQLWPLAEAATPKTEFAAYTQAIMDIGATLCTRSKPQCASCPLKRGCKALRQDRVTELPHRKAKKALPRRATFMLMYVNPKKEILLVQRPASGIWGGLWSFEELESLAAAQTSAQQRFPIATIETWPKFKHTFSHYHLDITPVLVRIKDSPNAVVEPSARLWYPLNPNEQGSTKNIGLAAPVKALLQKLQTTLS